VHVLRIPASRVYRDIHGVMDEIILTLADLEHRRSPGLSLAPSTPRSSAG
jgi:very-short-patch-repair endonuclease